MYTRKRLYSSFALVALIAVALFISTGMMARQAYKEWKKSPSYRTSNESETIDKITLIRLGSETILDSVESKYAVLAETILGTDQIAIWAVTEEGRIPLRENDWLVLDTCEIRRTRSFTAPPGFVGIEVRTLD